MSIKVEISSTTHGQLRIGISNEVRAKCIQVFALFDELKTPDNLRGFASTIELEYVKACVPNSDNLPYDNLLVKLLETGRSFLEPALFDLLDELASRYAGQAKGDECKDLLNELKKAIPTEDSERANDYKMLVNNYSRFDDNSITKKAKDWIDTAHGNLDELALRITLAVFNGTPFREIERAKKDLQESFEKFLPLVESDKPSPVGVPIPLMRRIEEAGAYEKEASEPEREGVIVLHQSELGSEAITYVWQQYREKEWRQKLIDWLTRYAVGRSVEVRNRAAAAVGRLAIKDYLFVRDNLIQQWVWADHHEAQYRAAVGTALDVLIRTSEKKLASEVQKLLRLWSQSQNQPERWAAMRAYIYVGVHCQPVSQVITHWHDIAASEPFAVDVQLFSNVYVRLTNPLHMSLVDAMTRFFMELARLPEDEKSPKFEGVLEGLEKWIAADEDESCIGLFMFLTLGKLTAPPMEEGGLAEPVLLELLGKSSNHSTFRKALSRLFYLTLGKAASVLEAMELLSVWLKWIDNLPKRPYPLSPNPYEMRLRELVMDIIALDNTGAMQERLRTCLRESSKNGVVERVLAN